MKKSVRSGTSARSVRAGVAAVVRKVSFALGVTAALSGCKEKGHGWDLPPTATNVQVAEIDMFPDWEYYFRATMPPADCEALLLAVAAKEHLTKIAAHDFQDGRGDWGPMSPPGWWGPEPAGSHHHGRTGDVNTCAMCSDGVFYYWQGSH